MTTNTLGRIIQLPSAGSASLSRAGQPLGAGWAQLAASNATHYAREKGLRVLAEHPGTSAVGSEAWRALEVADHPEYFRWEEDSDASEGAFIICAGLHLLRPWGESPRLPRVEARWRWRAEQAGDTCGAVMVVTPGLVRPSYRDHPSAYATLTSTTMTNGSATVTIDGPERLLRRSFSPHTAAAADPDEAGEALVFSVFLGFFNTSNQAAYPTHVRQVSIFLREPS